MVAGRIRRFVFITIAIVAIAVCIREAWFQQKKIASTTPPPVPLERNYEEKIFELQAKALVGGMLFLRQQAVADPTHTDDVESLVSTIRESAQETLFTAPQASPISFKFRAQSAILARRLEFEEIASKNCDEIIRAPKDQTDDLVRASLQRVCEKPIGSRLFFSDEERARIAGTLGWFGQLLISDADEDPRIAEHYRQSSTENAIKTFTQFLMGLGIFTIVFVGSSVLCLLAIGRTILGRFRLHYRPSEAVGWLCFEVFVLYICGMFAVSHALGALQQFGFRLNPLLANCVATLLLLLVLCWPRFWGVSWSELRKALGLGSGRHSWIAELLFGPLAYLTAILPLFVVLLVYSTVLSALGVDPGQGTHPIVPIITQSDSSKTLLLVVVTAVIVAPLIEEIMFRGALYSWMRTKLSAAPTIFLSSVLFAALHPQGAVGLVPLTFIGMILAFLREWRGSLLTPMAAHACFNAGTLALVYFFFK